jgi:uncharacterized protein DUF1488
MISQHLAKVYCYCSWEGCGAVPNSSRSYDATRRTVRFWGYDRSMESSFFVTADALKQIQPNLWSDAVDLRAPA